MAKKKPEKPQRVFTRHQISHYQQQKKKQRIILGLGITIVTAVILIMGAGWFVSQYQPMHEKAITVNDTEFNMQYYVEMLKLQSKDQPAEYVPSLANSIILSIEQNELLRQEALKLGISISEDEIETELKNHEPPYNDAHKDFLSGQLLVKRLLDGYFDNQVPVNAEQVYLMAMLLESEAQVNEIKARLENSDNFTDLAREKSLDYFSRLSGGDYGWHSKDILGGLLPGPIIDSAFTATAGVLSRPIYDEETEKGLGYWLVKILDRNVEEEETHVLLMLLGSEEAALNAGDRLDAGESFGAVAGDLSQMKGAEENKGEYMLTPGMMSPTLDEYIFDPEIPLQTVSEPIIDESVATQGGYWLLKITGREMDRPIEDDDRSLLKAKAFEEWFTERWDHPDNQIDHSYLNEDNKAWAIKQVVKSGI